MLRVLLAVLLVAGLAWVAPSARADDSDAIAVTITGNTAPVLDLRNPQQVIELSGVIINTSATRVRYVNINFWCATDALTSRAQLAGALTSDPTTPLGHRPPPNTEESGHVVTITGDQYFEPGARASFKVRATVGELGFATDEAAYLVGVQVRGIPDDGTRMTIGRARILVVATAEPIEVASVVALTGKPTRSVSGDFTDDSLAGELTGRLEKLLVSAERPGATALLDPSLVAEVAALAEEHTVDGAAQPPNPTAARWTRRVQALADQGRALRLPFANPDVAAAHAAGRLNDVMGWAERAVVGNPIEELPLAVDVGPHGNQGLVDALTGRGVRWIFADNAVDGAAVVPVAAFHEPGMGPGARETTAQQTSRRLAEEVLSPHPRTYLVRTTEDAQAAVALADREHVVDIPTWTGAPEFGTAAVPAPLREQLFTRVDDLVARSAFLKDLTGTDDATTLVQVAAKANSQGFTTQEAALDYLALQPRADVDPSLVTVSAAKQFVMGSRTNNFPVTVTNGLAAPVTVRLVFESESPQRISVPATDFVTIAPGEVMTLTITPEASSNSVVSVRAQLETQGGTRFGPVVPIEITATDLGRVGWIIIIVSGAVVLGGTFLRIRAVQAERAKENRGNPGQ